MGWASRPSVGIILILGLACLYACNASDRTAVGLAPQQDGPALSAPTHPPAAVDGPSREGANPARGGGSPRESAAWTLAEPAVHFAASAMELAVLKIEALPGANRAKQFTLLSMRNEEPVIEIAESGRNDVTITTRWAPFRNEERENALREAVRRRLDTLIAGGGIAPD